MEQLAKDLTRKPQTRCFCQLRLLWQISKTGHLNNMVMEAGKSKIKLLADLVPGESPLPDL